MKTRFYPKQADFVCKQCGYLVTVQPVFSGVLNRNHCPYCLWSRHVDLCAAGDRLSACKALMQPVGLTIKQEHKRYGHALQGEIMLIHQCVECAALSINRLAADDDPQGLLEVYERSLCSEPGLTRRLDDQGIVMLKTAHAGLVQQRLLGRLVAQAVPAHV
ncbi:MAG: RNHCP domain-containing protein [Chloroflexota bacterium]|jgi:hypothetical protein